MEHLSSSNSMIKTMGNMDQNRIVVMHNHINVAPAQQDEIEPPQNDEDNLLLELGALEERDK